MRAIIEHTATKYGPAIKINGNDAWLKVTDEAFKYAKKGPADIEQNAEGVVVKIRAEGGGADYGTTAASSPTPTYQKEDPSKQRNIVRQSVLKMAVELVSNDKIHLDQLFDNAAALENWVYRE